MDKFVTVLGQTKRIPSQMFFCHAFSLEIVLGRKF